MDIFTELFGMFDDFDSIFTTMGEVKGTKKCPVCGSAWQDIRKNGRFGCSECYVTFSDSAKESLRQIHATSHHNGKLPSKSGAEIKLKRKLEELRTQLKEAVAKEEYEVAAKLHAEITELEGGIK